MTSSWYDRQPTGLLNDSITLNAYLYSDNTQAVIPQGNISGVTFTVMTPTDPAGEPSINGVAGNVVADGQGQYVVLPSVNIVPGHYRGFARFTYNDDELTGLNKSIMCNYEIEDPFQATGQSPADPYVDQTWLKLSDLFDSSAGGPWLRDMTMDIFDKYKLRGLIPEALLEINQQMPFTDFTEDSFPYTQGDAGALFAEALLVSTIRHLMRSYTEQPDVTSSPVAFMDRKRYQEAWGVIYQIEKTVFDEWLNRWKLRSYDLSHSSVLVAYKSGRTYGPNARARNVSRGGF